MVALLPPQRESDQRENRQAKGAEPAMSMDIVP